MADQQYDITLEQRKILLEKAKRRAILRHEFQKQISNPHTHATEEAGYVFDAAVMRYNALKVSEFEHFKPTPKSSRIGILLVGVPILAYAYLLKSHRDSREHLYRTGQVAYKDRSFKFQ